jgi:hypothetical protein
MYYTVYKIRNEINKKIYIGVHKTEDLDDSYMGSGYGIVKAIKKYGVQNFTKRILKIFPSEEMAYLYESMLVNQNFINSSRTYNMSFGGYRGPGRRPGFTLSEERKKTISQKLLGHKQSAETIEKRTQSLKLARENGKMKYVHSEAREIAWAKGWKVSESGRINIANANIIKWQNPEFKAKRKADMLKTAKKGSQHYGFKGYWVTPLGTFESSSAAASAHGVTKRTIQVRCKQKIDGYIFIHAEKPQ